MIYVNARFLSQEMTGVQRFAEQICISLNQLRDDIIFVAPKDVKRHDIANKLNVRVIGTKTGHLWEQLELPRYLKQQGQPLLINLCNTAPIFYKKQIVTHHDITYKVFPQSYSRKFRVLYNTLIPMMLKNSRALITVSEFSRHQISKAYNYNLDKIHVLSNATGEDFRPVPSSRLSKDRYLLAVSSANYHKNFHGLLKAFMQLPVNNDVKLKIIGSQNKSFTGVDFSGINTSDNVEFVGRVTDDELIKLYSNALAFVFPSFYEGFGIPPLEAQACGCPVISSNQASLPEVLADSALFFNPYDNHEMVNVINRVVSDEKLRDELRVKGFQNITNFSWKDSARKLNGIIEKLN